MGMYWCLCFQHDIWLEHVEWHQTGGCQIISNQESKKRRTDWHVLSHQMLMGLRNSLHSSSGKQHILEHSKSSQVCNWGSITKVTQKPGQLPISIKIGSSSGIKNSKHKTKKYFSCKITFLATLFLPIFGTFKLKTSSQTLLHISNQRIKVSSNASRLTTMPDSSNEL
jgi:hypothetical protein